jgi:glycosyltransferase involved in cell wall biosynthesis
VREPRPDVSVISSAHDLADARLHRTCAGLLRAGLSVQVIGLGELSGAPTGVAASSLGDARGKRRRLGNAVTLPFRARGRVTVTFDPDLVPAATLRRALARLRPGPRPGAVLAVDVHEDYLALLHDRAWAAGVAGTLARLLVRLALVLTRRADLTVVADAHVPPLTARRRLVVRNLPDPGYLPAAVEPDPVPRAVYIGDVRRSRGLADMLAAIEAAPGWELDVVGPVHPADAGWLADWAATSAAADRVRLHGRLAPSQAWALAAGASVGLALLADTPAFRAAIPTKLYEYLGSGLAVLATPLPRMAEIVRSSGAGVVVEDAAAAGAALRDYSADPAALRAARKAALEYAAARLSEPSPSDELATVLAELADRG